MDKKIGFATGVMVFAALVAGALYTWQSNIFQPAIEEPRVGKVEEIAHNLKAPWSLVFYDGTPLVSLRDTGEIIELDIENNDTRVVGTVPDATPRGEGGLLGLAVRESYLYAYYTTTTDNRISRFVLQGKAGELKLGEEELILDSLPSASYHNGGRIAFGPDDMLYAAVGDAGDIKSAQDLSRLSGKILRMTPSGDVPSDNPFDDSLVYSYGHRNPQGIAWDDSGTMYSTEFGQNAWDELNIITAGANYGWPEIEGIEDREGFVAPVQQWRTGEASPSGITHREGILYIANLRGEVLRLVSTNSLGSSEVYFHEEYGRIRDTAISSDGNVWFVTNNTDGRGSPAANDDRILSIQPR